VNAGGSSARALGYKLLGSRLDYLLHLRPAEWPIMAGHTLLGALLALGFARAASGEQAGAVLLGLVLWVVALNGGTLAINSAFDRDEGDVAYLRRPPPPPRGLFAFGLGLMLTGLFVSLLLPRPYTWLYLTCLLMSVLYSVPPARLKAVAGADWIINLLGFGTLTPLAGWASTGEPLTVWGWFVVWGFGALFAGLYPLTQLYQFDEDERRGDRTFALLLGKRRSMAISIACVTVAFGLFMAGARVAGWTAADTAQWTALAVAFIAWLAVLLPWYRRASAWAPARHQRGMYLALGAWAVTDVAVLFGWAWPGR
jgi:4-hydroxybenzoate polyprenyltransferase